MRSLAPRWVSTMVEYTDLKDWPLMLPCLLRKGEIHPRDVWLPRGVISEMKQRLRVVDLEGSWVQLLAAMLALRPATFWRQLTTEDFWEALYQLFPVFSKRSV